MRAKNRASFFRMGFNFVPALCLRDDESKQRRSGGKCNSIASALRRRRVRGNSSRLYLKSSRFELGRAEACVEFAHSCHWKGSLHYWPCNSGRGETFPTGLGQGGRSTAGGRSEMYLGEHFVYGNGLLKLPRPVERQPGRRSSHSENQICLHLTRPP
ncbi:hypothetical protein BGZ60DRAFT_172433 [Tricladium varicosporioides]|nr:hypothetical protein BGZ60DRAFT_172433 [Hymenoscyphus varicosporioides]